MMHIYSPLRYPGGKSRIFPFVSHLLEENGMRGIAYAEPYAGGAGLALKLLIEGWVDHIYINDLNPSIYTLWKVLLTRTEEFCQWLSSVDVSIDNWKKYKEMQNRQSFSDELEMAQSTFFLNRTNVSGVIKGGPIGGMSQNGKYKLDARFKKEVLLQKIRLIAQYKDKIHLTNEDGINFLKRLSRKHESIFVYLDPPYYQKGSDLYMNYFKDSDHENLCKAILRFRKYWMISYDKEEYILELYKNFPMVEYQLAQFASNRIGQEVLIFDKKIKYANSLSCLVNIRYLNK